MKVFQTSTGVLVRVLPWGDKTIVQAHTPGYCPFVGTTMGPRWRTGVVINEPYMPEHVTEGSTAHILKSFPTGLLRDMQDYERYLASVREVLTKHQDQPKTPRKNKPRK